MSGDADIHFEHYRVLRRDDGSLWELRGGTVSVTFKALDERMDRPVALTVLRDEFAADRAVRDQFLDEARTAARLQHSNVIAVHYLSGPEPPCFCVTEFVQGENLESLVRRVGKLDVSTALKITDQAARALREIWQHGCVHRELRPVYWFLGYEGDEMRVRLANLEILRAGGDAGKPEPDIRSNLFSLGCLLWFLLEGAMPAEDGRAASSAAPRQLPRKVAALLEKLLQRDPAKRVQTPVDLRDEIAYCLAREPATGPGGCRFPDASDRADPLAEHFNLGAPMAGGGNAYFEAENRLRGGRVVVHLFSPEEASDSIERAGNLALRLLSSPHDHFVRPVEVSMDGRRPFVAYERIHGFRLLDLLRKRRRLPLAETVVILRQVAAAVDHAASIDLGRLDLTVATVWIAFAESAGERQLEERIALPLRLWPSFAVKVPPHGSLPGVPATGDAMTRPSLEKEGPGEADVTDGNLHAMALLAYELLGGVRSRAMNGSFAPLAVLSETGNQVLKQAFASAPFQNAGAFVDALHATGEPDLPPAGPVAAIRQTEPYSSGTSALKDQLAKS